MWEPLVPSSYHHTSCRARPHPRSYCRTSWRSWRRPQCRDRRPQPADPPSTPAESRQVVKTWCFGCSTTLNLTFLFIDNVSRAERSLSGSINDFSSSCSNVNFEGNFFFSFAELDKHVCVFTKELWCFQGLPGCKEDFRGSFWSVFKECGDLQEIKLTSLQNYLMTHPWPVIHICTLFSVRLKQQLQTSFLSCFNSFNHIFRMMSNTVYILYLDIIKTAFRLIW